MSNDFYLKYGDNYTKDDVKEFCKRPGKHDEDGNPIYTTEQHHKERCDAGNIIRKYSQTGVITHISNFEDKFGNMTGLDFKEAMDIVVTAQSNFNQLPSNIRNRFQNNPQELLTFMENPLNRDEAIELGMIDKDWTVETDGLGEHVQKGKNVDGAQEPQE